MIARDLNDLKSEDEINIKIKSPGFVDLPEWVEVLESTVPRSVIAHFHIHNSTPDPELHILSVALHATVFETPIINPTNVSDSFTAQIMSESDSTVCAWASTPPPATSRRLFTSESSTSTSRRSARRGSSFQVLFSQWRFWVEVRVPEDAPPSELLYTVLARDPDENGTFTASILDTFEITQVLPVSSVGHFQIDGRGRITSNQTFDYQNGPRSSCSERLRFGEPRRRRRGRDRESRPECLFYMFVKPYPSFKIELEDGVIRTAYNLDLEADRTLTQTVLLVRAISVLEDRSGTATVTVNVLDVNEHPPPVIILTLPETTEVGHSLGSITCLDIDVSNHNISLTLIQSDVSHLRFRLWEGQLQVNSSLDYDNEAVAANSFQYEVSVMATDSWSPALSTEVRVPITVTPVNVFDPWVVSPLVLMVPEDSQHRAVVAVVQAVDQDWPFHSIRLSIAGGHALFSIDPIGGQLYLRSELDFEEKDFHTVKVQAVDFDQDVDRTNLRTSVTDITIQVQNVNDNAPVCDPLSYESTIFSTLAAGVSIVTLTCTDADRYMLTATITNGH
ncbi:cadherin-related family member 4-like [Hemibagrus wyckioides]|uniref:cadherin-related family member 4-like n=1 Tax=Hemibagrus wyckioides TaxID=337641 RepID=UPI00266C3F29|nr:cadherin-related family member 4-like [Hemibagrus wyckioides]